MANRRLKTDPLPTFDERRQLREAAGLSQADLAFAIGVSPSAVHTWETKREPKGLQRVAYVKALRDMEEGTT